jgi:uncharacterized membrane protein YfcA
VNAYICITLICFVGGLSSGATGFGGLIIMVPLFTFFLDMNTAIPLGIFCGIGLQSAGILAYRTHIAGSPLLRMLLGSLPGVWLGSTVLLHMPEIWLRAALGALIICYVLWNFFGTHAVSTRPPAALWAYVAGFFSGAFGGAFGVIGPPAVMYAARTGWPPDAIRGFLGVYFTVLFVVIAISQILHGLVGPEVWRLAAWAAPVCLGGWLVGKRLTARLVPAQYMRLVFTLLLVMGLSLCWPAARMLIFG